MLNPILSLIVAGQYETAWEAFQTLEQPSPTDERWAGYALAILGRGFEARDLLLRARRHGCVEAGIELSFTQQAIGETKRAKDALKRLDLESFSGLDRAFAERQAGMLALSDGDYRRALDAFERAWVSAHDDDDGGIALPGIAQALGFVCSHLGFDARADQYYGFALERGSSAMRGSLLLARAASRINLDRMDEAEADLHAAKPLLENDAFSQASLEHHAGLLCGAREQWLEASQHFAQAVKLADAVGNSVIACSAELGAASALLALDDRAGARRHLDRAAKRCETPDDEADLALLEGELRVRNDDSAQAVAHLERAAKGFSQLNSDRSAGRAYLYLAAAHLNAKQVKRADAALERAAHVWQSLGPGSMLGELRSLSGVLEHLKNTPDHPARLMYDGAQSSPSLAGQRNGPRVVLRSLGRTALELNGSPVRFKLRRALEVLAYLLRHPTGVSVNGVACDLFPDAPPRQAQLYFHQVRYELEKKIPGLSVPLEATTRLYTMQYRFTLSWDVLEFERLLLEHEGNAAANAFEWFQGSFMPEAEGDWVETERAQLNALALKFGLTWCETWFEQHQHQRCIQLATRLLELDPLDEHLSGLLVRATEALEGRAAARQTVKRLRKRFETELGVTVAFNVQGR